MISIEAKTSFPKSPAAAPWWPFVAALFAGFIYYLALWMAFWIAIGDVVPGAANLPATGRLYTLWKAHWLYRIFAESISIAFGTFIAGGLARERASIAGLIGGLGISLGWTVRLAFRLSFLGLIDPWYEIIIEAIIVIAAPMVGYIVGEVTAESGIAQQGGFAGVPRAHFLWLWFPTYGYAIMMIGPYIYSQFKYLYTFGFESLIRFLVYILPLAAFATPLVLGLALMSGHIGNLPYRAEPMPAVLRQTLGVIVLFAGWWVAAAIQILITGAVYSALRSIG